MLKNKKLLILGGSRISCEIIHKARELGVYTGVTDWYEYEKSPAKQLADNWHMVSTADTEAMVDLIKEENYDGIITGFTDSVLPYYAEICDRAGLPCYGTKEQFEILINKNKYKSLCEEFGVPIVNEYLIKDINNEAELDRIDFPVLVKPSDSSGARGVSICQSKKELIQAYHRAMEFSQAKEVLIERYITGEEVTVFLTFIDGNIYLSGIGNRHIKHNQKGVIGLPVAYTFPSIYTKGYVKNILPKVEKMLKSIGIQDGMMFMQCLVENETCILYDLGYRLTGSLEYKLLDDICSYDPLEMMIKFALTGKMTSDQKIEEKITPFWKKYACNVSYLIKPGTIKRISGIEELLNIPGVIDAVEAHIENETLSSTSLGTLKQIAIRAFGIADDQEELKELLDKMYHSIVITSDKDKNLLLEGLDVNDIDGKLL